MAHHCKALMLHCMDFRLPKAMAEIRRELGIDGSCDLVAVAGGSRELVRGTDAARTFILRQLELARELHGITGVVLVNHTDCGAYGGRAAFADADAENAAHIEDLTEAARTIRTRFPTLNVRLFLARVSEEDGHIRVNPEELR